MNRIFPTIVFVIMIFLIFEVTIEAKEQDSFLSSLQQCSKALDSSEKALQSSNACAPSLQYREVGILEKERNKWLEYILLARSRINSLKKRKNIKDTFGLFSILKKLDLEMDGVRAKLFEAPYEPAIDKDKKPLIENDCIKLIENADKELDAALVIFTDAADSYMDIMDKRIMRCK